MAEMVDTLLTRNLYEVFGERDAEKRRAVIAEIWNPDGVFVDSHGRHAGYDALSDAVEGILAKFPDFVFAAIGAAQTFSDIGRLAWGFGPSGETPTITGMDVVVVAGGRIAAVYAFVDAPPAS